MAKWEYCVISGFYIGGEGTGVKGFYPTMICFRTNGTVSKRIQKSASMDEPSMIAATIA